MRSGASPSRRLLFSPEWLSEDGIKGFSLERKESGADGDRTRDLHAASVALSRLSYGPKALRV
jgi:hypothetical protein